MALFNLRFRASTKGATRALLPGIARDFNKILKRNKRLLENGAKDIILVHIRDHQTYKSLLSDDGTGLRAELGLADPIGEIEPILQHWENSIKVLIDDVRVTGNRLSGGIIIQGINASFRDATNLPTASFYAERAREKNITPFLIEWLDWLLLKGANSLVFGFFVDTDLKPTDNSRTGLAVMRDQKVVKLQGIEWQVPVEYQGTKDKNWITDSVAEAIDEVEAFILSEILPQIGNVQTFGRR